MEYQKIMNLTDHKIADRITKISKNSQQVIQKQIQISMIKRYLKKDIYLQKKDKKIIHEIKITV